MSRVRVGCVGTGFIAGKHLAALASFDDVDVVAVADSIPELAEQVAAAIGATAYADGLALLDREDLDAVWLCVPPFAHGPLEDAAVDRGLPFFVEKPLACDVDTARRIADRVRAAGLPTAVGYHWRYLTLVDRAREVLDGRPPSLVMGSWLDSTPAAPWWVERRRSGGQILEQTTHLFDLARVLVGDVDAVHAVELAAGPEQATDDVVPIASTATLHFASGAIGTVTSARFLHARHRVALHLMGPGYAVELSERSLVAHELLVSTAEGTRVEATDEDPIRCEDRAFVDAITGRGDDVRASYEEALRTHELAWAADRSARQGGELRQLGAVRG